MFKLKAIVSPVNLDGCLNNLEEAGYRAKSQQVDQNYLVTVSVNKNSAKNAQEILEDCGAKLEDQND